ncbi:hypothetical protein LMH87_009315 [Akanthomyces muscarius]|uniref:DJ-1/PfpI domain-containing protein n=1 Tax=Akanthomyces muscarius TaxID=2231603 RepID=A0A9W8QB54_AKAMU|nr:hypothetical protein LMH87_009315 [Akanthomyces muscarius]KAJ4152795.1 hypothetical protein LMH87_009315 [Akanthomyces muscarius]
MSRENPLPNTTTGNEKPSPRNIAVIAWTGMDLTDFTSSIEVFSHVRDASRARLYKTTTVGDDEISITSQGTAIKREITTEDFIANKKSFDILVIPGGGGFTGESMPQPAGLLSALREFKQLDGGQGQRVILSICAGSFFLGQAGLLEGKVATAHPKSLADLKRLCAKHGGSTIVRQHYVDAGLSETGIRIVTSAGITSGFDAALYVVETEHGFPAADMARAIMDAEYRREALPFGIF